MQIYPAIDIRGGRVVRRVEGRRPGATVYGDDPYAQALAFQEAGARWLHVVDMDRAFQTGGDNTEWIHRIAAIDDVKVQVGGNVSTGDWAQRMLDAGADRVILGTATALDRRNFDDMVSEIGPGRCGLAVDVRSGALALRGTSFPSPATVHDVVNRALAAGVPLIVFRDLDRDGLVVGADIAGAARVAETGARVVVAGGVAGLDDVRAARRAGLDGVIVGRALYEGRFTLHEAEQCLS